MHKAPVPENEAERLNALYESGLLDTLPEAIFDDVTQAAATICQVPIAVISLIDKERQWFKSAWGVYLGETLRETSICAHTVNQGSLLTVPDLLLDPRFVDNPAVVGEAGIRFYAGAPLVTSEGYSLGTLCVVDRVPRHLSPEQESILLLLAAQVAGRIELQRRIALQGRALEERAQAEQALRHAEQRLRFALEGSAIGFWEFSFQGGDFVEVSPACKVLLGLGPDTPLSYNNFLQVVHPDDRTRVEQSFSPKSPMVDQGNLEYRVCWADGSLHWLNSRATFVRDDRDEAQGMIGISAEITSRKRREARREQALQEAQEEADRDALTGLLNHRAFHKCFQEEAERAVKTRTRLAVVMLDIDNFKFFNEVYGHTTGDAVLRQVGEALKQRSRSGDTLARFGGDEFALLLPDVSVGTMASSLEARLRSDLALLTFETGNPGESPVPLDLSIGVAFCQGETAAERSDAINHADERLRDAKIGSDIESEAEQVRLSAMAKWEGFSMLDALVTAVNNKDRYTRRHSEDVMRYSLRIARRLNFSEERQQTVAVAALLHDVGKIGVPDRILRKPGALTAAEFEAVRHHPQMGASLVATAPGLEGILDAVLYHHERWDGEGYPAGLTGEATPLIARLLAVADAFSAMTTDRPYRKGLTAIKAMTILQDGAGSQWDPLCVTAFAQSAAEGSPSGEPEK